MTSLHSAFLPDRAVAPPLILKPSDRIDVGAGASPQLGSILLDMGALRPAELALGLAHQQVSDEPLGETLVRQHRITPAELDVALARQRGIGLGDLLADPPDLRLVDAFGPGQCLATGVLPWKRAGYATLVAARSESAFRRARTGLESRVGPARMVRTTDAVLTTALLTGRRAALARAAETRLPLKDSCRGWAGGALRRVLVGTLGGLALSFALFPSTTFLVLFLVLLALLWSGVILRSGAALAALKGRRADGSMFRTRRVEATAAPRIGLLVPLFRERQIAAHLVKRLSALDYPRDRLDLCLVVEEDDWITEDSLRRATLPSWMRIIRVPHGTLKTKPRAMNYALGFLRGDIVGIYDAEDAPAPGQLWVVAREFGRASPDVACLQGRLAFYNERQNWMARCFAIDYAIWFHLILPGLARLGLPIPLGGTTLFFRRHVLEGLGAWDAHNVTEDADLGLRLARAGFRTELIDTETQEEATCQPGAWVRQRSRWIKGYAITYAQHMRRPWSLWQELGASGFIAVQILFLGSVVLALFAPLLWTLWALPLSLPHPLETLIARPTLVWIGMSLIGAEVLNIAVGVAAVRRSGRRWLTPWVPSFHIYAMMGSLAALKALWELLVRPFFWDKTAHGMGTSRRWRGVSWLRRPT
ncbi:MAG: glycosyltransferase [Pseudomonadota bacterium]